MFTIPAALVPAQAAIVRNVVADVVAPLGSSAWVGFLADNAALNFHAERNRVANIRAIKAAWLAGGVEADSGLLELGTLLPMVRTIAERIAALEPAA
jgi:hypothetical protein